MRKIKTVFVLDRDASSLATPNAVPDSAWVLAGEGVATVKFDGTSCLVRDGVLHRRLDRKLTDKFARLFRSGKVTVLDEAMFKPMQPGWEPCEAAPDRKTGHWPGWLPITAAPENVYHNEAYANAGGWLPDGTYELVGPAISSTTHAWVDGRFERCGSVANRYGLARHELWRHGTVVAADVEPTFAGIRTWLEAHEVEGLVFHHPDGRMAKIRRKDFGLPW